MMETKTKLTYKQVKDRIKQQIKIIDIADEFGLTVINPNGKIAKLAEHDSVNIYTETNSFFRYASGVGGDVLKFMKEMPEINMDFKDAYNMLAKRIDPSLELKKITRKKSKNDKSVPPTMQERQKRAQLLLSNLVIDENCKAAMAYLIKVRKIEPKIVYDFINKGCLCQETNDKGQKMAVFVGRDDMGMIATVCKRAASEKSHFKSEAKGCDYRYGWLYDPQVDPRQIAYGHEKYDPDKTLICFESEIEKMSYLSILKLQGEDINKYAYLSTGSATKYKNIIDVVKLYGYRNVIVAYNNDIKFNEKGEQLLNSGQFFANKAVDELEKIGVHAKSKYPEKENDWNDQLRSMKNVLEKKEQSISSRKDSALMQRTILPRQQKKEIVPCK